MLKMQNLEPPPLSDMFQLDERYGMATATFDVPDADAILGWFSRHRGHALLPIVAGHSFVSGCTSQTWQQRLRTIRLRTVTCIQPNENTLLIGWLSSSKA